MFTVRRSRTVESPPLAGVLAVLALSRPGVTVAIPRWNFTSFPIYFLPWEGLPSEGRHLCRRRGFKLIWKIIQVLDRDSDSRPSRLWLDLRVLRRFFPHPPNVSFMLRQVLKSKLHRAVITDADVNYEGSIEIPRDLMDAADLWPGEKVLVASITTGARLETYVLEGKAGTGKILINGGAAHLIREGERVTIMAFAITDTPPDAKSFLLDDYNQVVREAH